MKSKETAENEKDWKDWVSDWMNADEEVVKSTARLRASISQQYEKSESRLFSKIEDRAAFHALKKICMA